eukprot:scaffold650_cov201-Ochromonas_danica.AAC.1
MPSWHPSGEPSVGTSSLLFVQPSSQPSRFPSSFHFTPSPSFGAGDTSSGVIAMSDNGGAFEGVMALYLCLATFRRMRKTEKYFEDDDDCVQKNGYAADGELDSEYDDEYDDEDEDDSVKEEEEEEVQRETYPIRSSGRLQLKSREGLRSSLEGKKEHHNGNILLLLLLLSLFHFTINVIISQPQGMLSTALHFLVHIEEEEVELDCNCLWSS